MSNTRTCINAFGHRMTVFRNDHVGDRIASQGLYEKDNLMLLLALLRSMPQCVVLDVGANVGNHTLAFATVARQVHAFEPIPRIHALLQQNTAGNSLDNVTLHALALSDCDDEAVIHMVTAGNYGASSFDTRSAEAEPVTVQRRRGDALLAQLGVDKVDFIKIDVEAHEVYVLRGLMNTLQQHRPVITMEWNDRLTVERMRGSPELQFLTDNYQILVLGSSWDRLLWSGKPFAGLRRLLTKLFKRRQLVLYRFDPARLYKNLLLIPHGRSDLLQLLQPYCR